MASAPKFQFIQRWPQLAEFFTPKIPEDTIELLDNRDRDLEDFLEYITTGDIIIDFGDVIYVGVSKAYRAGVTTRLKKVVAHLAAIASANIVMEILKNGLVIGTLTIVAGQQEAQVDVNVGFAEGDYWQMRVTAASDGAGLVVQGSF